MPESTSVRKLAAVVAREMGKAPWHQHRNEVLPEVYRRLQMPAYVPRDEPRPGKRRRTELAECAVCLEYVALVVLAPCGHKRICGPCAAKCRGKCPMCRQRFRLFTIYD